MHFYWKLLNIPVGCDILIYAYQEVSFIKKTLRINLHVTAIDCVYNSLKLLFHFNQFILEVFNDV